MLLKLFCSLSLIASAFIFFIGAPNPCAQNAVQYILYACPIGETGDELLSFWEACKDSEMLRNDAVTSYPPHISLTSFFDGRFEESLYALILEDAIEKVRINEDIRIRDPILKKRHTYHAIYFESSYLRKVAETFSKNAWIPKSKLKSKRSKPVYHLTLARHFEPEAKDELSELENNINFKGPIEFNLCLYKLTIEGGKPNLTLIYTGVPRTQQAAGML